MCMRLFHQRGNRFTWSHVQHPLLKKCSLLLRSSTQKMKLKRKFHFCFTSTLTDWLLISFMVFLRCHSLFSRRFYEQYGMGPRPLDLSKSNFVSTCQKYVFPLPVNSWKEIFSFGVACSWTIVNWDNNKWIKKWWKWIINENGTEWSIIILIMLHSRQRAQRQKASEICLWA